VIRPPGAVTESLFLARCTRCGACWEVCPTKLLRPQNMETSILHYGTPSAVFNPAWCRADCTACTQVCPSGAIRPVLPAEKKNISMGQAAIQFEHCRLYDDKECSVCGRQCPFDAISFQWSDAEYRKIPIVDAAKCTGCGFCIVSCPSEHAIRVVLH